MKVRRFSVQYAGGKGTDIVYRHSVDGHVMLSRGRLEVVGATVAGLADAEDELVEETSDHTTDNGADPVYLQNKNKVN